MLDLAKMENLSIKNSGTKPKNNKVKLFNVNILDVKIRQNSNFR